MTSDAQANSPTLQTATRTKVWIMLGVWFSAALAFAASGALVAAPPPLFPVMVWGSVLSVTGFVATSPSFKAYFAATDLRPAVAYHIVRAPIGVAFLWLGTRGELDPAFVTIAGYGDILAGIGAIIALLAVHRRWANARFVLLTWNAFALLDILVVFVTAQRVVLFGRGIDAMRGILRFPLPMLLPFVVPMVIITHIWIFQRLRRHTELTR